MAAHVNLSTRDANVLEKIKDPEANPAAALVTDSSLPRDPHVTDSLVYEDLVRRERAVILVIQDIERQLSDAQTEDADDVAIEAYNRCLSDLDSLVAEHPDYASARNNRAQLLRRLYGDAMLLHITTGMPMPLIPQPPPSDRRRAARTVLHDIERSIALLSPATPTTPLSPQAARTLSMVHTQRAAIYLKTSKLLPDRRLDLDESLAEARWSRHNFEEAASRDLANGGRYGNQLAKSLAVSVNPTAKLCGQIVREALKKEYGPSFEV
ncbi:hypothetical protein DCS_07227 [Drechmeria coniospora]|uniref:Uncharacterized protein n=1 Tax=Drechmeria coniospora TaxID=98403 RepID=A0A151GDW0_DRECN|nr:hypothetical protein DCS_07227 [Drechmeria coniospora]KYK55264.1 hypothetical protein DCS_07227 [Drechmeria coniospora]ODA82120.1 hypothetical protein RJ55_00625 [Drechmeria coniospora]